jgi:hypothetical protein
MAVQLTSFLTDVVFKRALAGLSLSRLLFTSRRKGSET